MPLPPRTADAPFWEALHAAAQDAEPAIRDRILLMARDLRAALDLDAVERIVNGALGADWASGRIMQAFGLDRIVYDGITAEGATWERIAVTVGESSASALEQGLAIPEINMDRYFERVPRLLRTHSGNLITNLVGDQRETIRAVLAENWQRTPRQLAEAVRAVAGLQKRQALALERYRLALESRAGKRKLTPSEIKRRVEVERTRLSKIRGNVIARTETVHMANRAQHELWRVEKEAGHLSGIDLDAPFRGAAGELMYPPAHPNCLCAVQVIVLDGRFARQWIRVPVQQECDICDTYNGQVV